MAVTVARVAGADHVSGNKRVRVRTITLDSSYVQTGEPLTAAEVGLKKIEQAIPHGLAITSTGTTAWSVTPQINSAGTSMLLFVHGQEPADVTATSLPFPDADATENLSTFSIRMSFIGY